MDKEPLKPYDTLAETIEKRVDKYKTLRQAKKIPNLVGILYTETQHKYLNSILKNIQELSKRKNIKIICFTLGNVNSSEGLVEGIIVDPAAISRRTVTLPDCSLNIGNYTKTDNINKIKQIYLLHNSIVVNSVNIFNQAVVFDILSSVQAIKDSILPTATISQSILSQYLTDSNVIFLLPEKRAYNNPAVRIERDVHSKRNSCSIETGAILQYCGEENLFMHIKKMLANKRYIAIKGKKTLLWHGAPLEARVYVQKGITGKWSVTGMIAKNDIFLKDTIYEDTADELERVLIDIIPDKIEAIMQKLENISLSICSYIDYYFLYLGSSTIDYIFDEEGEPFIIGFGGWDRKNYLSKLNGRHTWDKYITNSIDYLIYLKNIRKQEGTLYDKYLHIKHMPLCYAAALVGFGREVRDSESEI